jgi:hypothetical protein
MIAIVTCRQPAGVACANMHINTPTHTHCVGSGVRRQIDNNIDVTT